MSWFATSDCKIASSYFLLAATLNRTADFHFKLELIRAYPR